MKRTAIRVSLFAPQVSEQEQTIENAYLKSCQDEKISFLFAGAVY